MIRITKAARALLLGGLLAPPFAYGQDSPKAEPPPPIEAPPAEPPKAEPAPTPVPVPPADPFFQYYQYYNVAQQNPPGARIYDALEVNFGLRLSDADEALRAQLEIPAGQGVVVVDVKPGSLAEQAGLKLNDVLLRLGDREAKSWSQARQLLLGLGKEALEVKLIREGKPQRMKLVGPEHGFPAEAVEYWIGTPVSRVDATLRVHLPALPADTGLIVNDVVKASPADQVSVKKHDILVSMDGKPLADADALIAQIQASQGKPVPLSVLRAGKTIALTITPAKRAHPTVLNARKNPNQIKYRVVRPGMAIEVDPNSVRLQPAPGGPPARPVDAKAAPSGGVAVTTPYTGVLVDPYAQPKFDFNSNLFVSSDPNGVGNLPTFPLNAYVNLPQALPDPATSRIEEQLKEVIAKLEAVTKALESLKKPAEK